MHICIYVCTTVYIYICVCAHRALLFPHAFSSANNNSNNNNDNKSTTTATSANGANECGRHCHPITPPRHPPAAPSHSSTLPTQRMWHSEMCRASNVVVASAAAPLAAPTCCGPTRSKKDSIGQSQRMAAHGSEQERETESEREQARGRTRTCESVSELQLERASRFHLQHLPLCSHSHDKVGKAVQMPCLQHCCCSVKGGGCIELAMSRAGRQRKRESRTERGWRDRKVCVCVSLGSSIKIATKLRQLRQLDPIAK